MLRGAKGVAARDRKERDTWQDSTQELSTTEWRRSPLHGRSPPPQRAMGMETASSARKENGLSTLPRFNRFPALPTFPDLGLK